MKKRMKRMLLVALLICFSCSFVSYGMEQEKVSSAEQSESDGEPVPIHTGWYEDENGNRYYYDQDGSLYSGWKSENGKWYYLDGANAENPGIMISNIVFKVGTQYYCFDENGVMNSSGWILRPEGWYYANADGSLVMGWNKIKGVWYYLDGNNTEYPGLMVENCIKEIDGSQYYFSVGGAMRTGWLQYSEGWYYADANGAQATGWRKIKGVWYYLDGNNTEHPGLMVEDCIKEIDGSQYYFSAGGAMRTGWLQYPEGWYYVDVNGAQAIGWRRIKGAWYYLDGDNTEYPGLMVNDCLMEINGNTYKFKQSGAMYEGWYQDGKDWYYYDPSGLIASGWRGVKGYWYYMDPADNNKMVSGGWKVLGNNWYFFNNNGSMATNWLSTKGRWYYLASDGAMRTGWQKVGGTWYYLYKKNDSHGGPEGAMAKSCYIDGYYLGANGGMLSPANARWVLRAQPYSSRTGYLILVDRAACRTSVFRGSAGAWNMICDWQCAPGKPSTPTVGGEFTVGSKGYYFDSGNARCYWFTQFYGDYLFHSVLYSKYNGSLMDGRVGMQLSHGCVRLAIQNAKWIYDNIPTGTKVVVF
mgnify:CR=1 FL=1